MSSTESGNCTAQIEQLLALHATVVQTACASENKRQSVSVTSSALISAGIAFYAADPDFDANFLIIPFLIISSIWFVTVRFYQQLARSKWKVIHEIEDSLVFQPFKREWSDYNENKGPFTFGPSGLEQIIPAMIFLGALIQAVRWTFF